jgi:hypothetical protein
MKPQVGQKKHQKSMVSDEENAFCALLRASSLIEFAQLVQGRAAENRNRSRLRDFQRAC